MPFVGESSKGMNVTKLGGIFVIFYGIEFVGDQLLFGGMGGYTHNWIYLWIEECK